MEFPNGIGSSASYRRASISKGHYEVGCREKEPAKRFVQCFLSS
jgi:hypothetical protein